MDRKRKSVIDTYYYNRDNSSKKNAIYCQQIDRFILVDDYDYWITFKTANVLSSKVAVTVYLLPSKNNNIDNGNCMNYSIFNKTAFKRSNVAELIRNQNPSIRKLESNNLLESGIPEDYKSPEGVHNLIKLKNYADFVNKFVYATEISNSKNTIDNKTIPNSFFAESWNDMFFSYEDKFNERSLYNEINSILYYSESIEEASSRIMNVFYQALNDKNITLAKVKWFYALANEENPFPEI